MSSSLRLSSDSFAGSGSIKAFSRTPCLPCEPFPIALRWSRFNPKTETDLATDANYSDTMGYDLRQREVSLRSDSYDHPPIISSKSVKSWNLWFQFRTPGLNVPPSLRESTRRRLSPTGIRLIAIVFRVTNAG